MKFRTDYNPLADTVKGYVEMTVKEWNKRLDMGMDYTTADELENAIMSHKTLVSTITNLRNKVEELEEENKRLKKESSEKSEWLKCKNEALDNLIPAYNKLEQECKRLRDNKGTSTNALTIQLTSEMKALKKELSGVNNAHNYLNKELIKTYAENNKLKDEIAGWKQKWEEGARETSSLKTQLEDTKYVLDTKNKQLSETNGKYRAALKSQKELADKLIAARSDDEKANLCREIALLKKLLKNEENAFKSIRHYYVDICKQLESADLDGDVITLPHNGKKIKINQPKVKKTEVSIKEEIDKLAAAGELAGLICTFFGIDDEEE